MPTDQTHVFPVEVDWFGGKLTQARTPNGQSLEVATPPVFPHGMEGFWSPEDLVVAASASCFILTLVSACIARDIPLHSLRVKARGHVGRRADGRYGFIGLDANVEAETSAEKAEQLDNLARRTERSCIVSTALEVPVHVEVEVSARQAA
jgi:organic hydroperoxide reductase OsmC/OhrA